MRLSMNTLYDITVLSAMIHATGVTPANVVAKAMGKQLHTSSGKNVHQVLTKKKMFKSYTFDQKISSFNAESHFRELQGYTAGDYCNDLVVLLEANAFETSCVCNVVTDTYAYAECTDGCPMCFNISETEDVFQEECVMKYAVYNMTEFGVNGTTLAFRGHDCSLLLDGENEGMSHCWIMGEEYVDYVDFFYNGQIEGTMIDDEICARTELDSCLEIDCSNLGYSSNFTTCDESTIGGIPVVEQILSYNMSEGYPGGQCANSTNGLRESLCSSISNESSGGYFNTKCSCNYIDDDKLTVLCEYECEECFEEEDDVTNCWLRAEEHTYTNITSTSFSYTLNSFAEFTKGELDQTTGWSHPTLGDNSGFPDMISIDDVKCFNVTTDSKNITDEECLLVDCSNLGYSSDWNSCDASTYDGNEVVSAIFKYVDSNGTAGECFNVTATQPPVITPSLTPSLTPVKAPADPDPVTATPTSAPVSTSATAAPSMASDSFILKTTILLKCSIISYTLFTYADSLA